MANASPDLIAGTAGTGFATLAWWADLDPLLSALAGLVAIVAGLATTWLAVERAINERRKRAKED